MISNARDYLGERIFSLQQEMQLLRKIVMWALDTELKGRADTQLNQRRVLMYLAVRVEMSNMRVRFGVVDLALDLGMEQRTVRRTLDKLESQGLITRSYTGTVRREYKIEYVSHNNRLSGRDLRLRRDSYADVRDAQVRVGHAYWFGLGVEKDEEQAVQWFRKAAEQGHSEAQKLLE